MKLTARQRECLPPEAFGDPKRRALPVPDLTHYAPAKARLAMMANRGEYTPAERARIAKRIDAIAASLRKNPERFAPCLRNPRDTKSRKPSRPAKASERKRAGGRATPARKSNAGDALDAARRSYKAFHWGNEPDSIGRASFPDADAPVPPVKLGELVEVVYRTSKGDRVVYDFEHRMRRPPGLYYGDGGLLVAGRVKVTERGIEQ